MSGCQKDAHDQAARTRRRHEKENNNLNAKLRVYSGRLSIFFLAQLTPHRSMIDSRVAKVVLKPIIRVNQKTSYPPRLTPGLAQAKDQHFTSAKFYLSHLVVWKRTPDSSSSIDFSCPGLASLKRNVCTARKIDAPQRAFKQRKRVSWCDYDFDSKFIPGIPLANDYSSPHLHSASLATEFYV